jgi:23S rRNA (adenine2503-C2)-methyltransferase
MGLARQLSDAEIFEQVARFAAELQKQQDEEQKQKRKNVPETVSLSTLSESQTTSTTRTKRLSNVVFMGMGEPLANYRNVKSTIHRITKELGIGGRRVTVSTVGIVEGIRKLTKDPDMPQVKLAVSLHSADDEERSALLPANRKNGGLSELMTVLREYIETTNRRITLEWALIAGTNDGIDTARKLGGLVQKYNLRSDMVHVNVIPLNPTQKYAGKPSRRNAVEAFCACLIREYGISCTPRVRRGIDIDAGCGQLKSKIQKNRAAESSSQQITPSSETHGDNGSAVILNGNQDQE